MGPWLRPKPHGRCPDAALLRREQVACVADGARDHISHPSLSSPSPVEHRFPRRIVPAPGRQRPWLTRPPEETLADPERAEGSDLGARGEVVKDGEKKSLAPSTGSGRCLGLADLDAIRAYIDDQFNLAQTRVDKMLAKEWVKTVHDRKAFTHPYTRGNATKPAWWPTLPVARRVGWELPHREPDHLTKTG